MLNELCHSRFDSPANDCLVHLSTVKTLSALKKEQREKVEELKRKTGYNSTRELLEKYDDAIKKNVRALRLAAPA